MKSELDRADIIDLLQYIGVTKILDKGRDNIQICCPIHGENTPSCGVSIEKQIFHCFACGASGTLSWLVYKSLPDEFKSLQQVDTFFKTRYKVDVNSYQKKLLRGIKRYEEYFTDAEIGKRFELPTFKLAPFKSGKETYQYIFDRGFTRQTVEEFKIGRDLENRTVTVPVFWEDNVLAGIIGRYIDSNRPKNARYKIYDFPKGEIVFPLNKIPKGIDTLVLVEGVFDALWLFQMGIPAVAILGNQMTVAQANIIKKICNRVVDMFDNDEGGRIARNFAREKLGKTFPYYVVDYPEGVKDPCDCSQVEIGSMLYKKSNILKRNIKRL